MNSVYTVHKVGTTFLATVQQMKRRGLYTVPYSNTFGCTLTIFKIAL